MSDMQINQVLAQMRALADNAGVNRPGAGEWSPISRRCSSRAWTR
jgi:hypothetical protein